MYNNGNTCHWYSNYNPSHNTKSRSIKSKIQRCLLIPSLSFHQHPIFYLLRILDDQNRPQEVSSCLSRCHHLPCTVMTLNTQNSGRSMFYSVTYILMESIDCANILVTETMLTLKLSNNSRASVISIQ